MLLVYILKFEFFHIVVSEPAASSGHGCIISARVNGLIVRLLVGLTFALTSPFNLQEQKKSWFENPSHVLSVSVVFLISLPD